MVVALTLFTLGCETSTFIIVGKRKRHQKEIIQLLPQKFDTIYLHPWLIRNNRTWIAISENQIVYTFLDPSPFSDIDLDLVRKSLEDFINKLDVLYISAENTLILQLAIEVINYTQIKLVTNLSMPLLTDLSISNNTLLTSMLSLSHTLIMNQAESSLLLAKLGISDWSNIFSPSLKEVIITRSEKGGIISSYPFTEWREYPSFPPKQIRCVVGAGDTFNGAYIKSRFIDGSDPNISCIYAAKIAAQKIETMSSSISIIK